MNAKRHAPPPTRFGPTAGGTAQPARSFKPIPHARAGRGEGAGDELVEMAGGIYQLRAHDRPVTTRPSGVYNFVRVQGQTRNQSATFLSSNAPHAALASGRPVLYAGTAAFQSGRLEWWSNYSGTYQPNAGFARQAALPTDRFVPWQKLQMGGVGLQRGMLADRRGSSMPDSPVVTTERPSDDQAACGPQPNAACPPAKPDTTGA